VDRHSLTIEDLETSNRKLKEIKSVQGELIEKLESRIKKHQDELTERLEQIQKLIAKNDQL
jgi:C4-dicarboxylate-specific signal transduction histidine kinase